MLEIIRESFDGIRTHRLRSMLTMLGIIIGIASIMAISSTILGTNEQIKQNLIGSGNNTVEVRLYQGEYAFESDYNQLPEYVPLFNSDILQDVDRIPTVESSSVYLQRSAYGEVVVGSQYLSNCTLYGVDEKFASVKGYVIKSGRGLLKEDFTAHRKVCIMEDTGVEMLFEGQNPVGRILEISGEPFTVVGVYTKNSAFTPSMETINDYYTYNGYEQSGGVMIPFDTWSIMYGYDKPLNVVVRAASTDDMTDAGKAVADLLNSRFSQTDTEVKYRAADILEQARKMQELSGSNNRLLIWVAGISLLVGGIGVMNIMLVSVTERTPEIGLKKALGARKRTISLQFLTEAGILTCMGGILGVIAGCGLAYVISRVSGVPIFISGYIVVLAVVFSFLIGLVFGALPAGKAAGLNPIDALHRE